MVLHISSEILEIATSDRDLDTRKTDALRDGLQLLYNHSAQHLDGV